MVRVFPVTIFILDVDGVAFDVEAVCVRPFPLDLQVTALRLNGRLRSVHSARLLNLIDLQIGP